MGAGTAQRGACLLISGKVRKNMEFVVFAGVLLLLFIFMIVQELIQTKNQEKLFKKYLRENYGKEPPKEYSLERFARLGSYLERHKEEKQLDDITWNDLGMDEVFRRIDRTYSAAGEEYLYYTLRNISCGREALEHLEEVVNWLQEQENIKVRIQLLMKRLGHLGKYSLYDYLDNLDYLGERSNRKIELHMMDLELLSLLAQAKVAYPEAEIDKLWHGILINQFHDILPGSSIHEVYEVTKKEYAEMEAEITALREERLDALTPAGEGVTVYNTTGFVRSDVVELGDCKAEALQDEAGNIYPVQKTADGAVAFLNNLPAKGSKTFAVVPAQVSAAPFEIATDGHKIDTPFYTVTFDEHGQMTGIFDKENRREVLKPGQAGNLFRVYEDKPIYYDNWDIDIFYTEKFWDVTDLQDFTWTENGPVRATLHIERNYSNSTLVQDIHFYAKQRRIEFVTTVDWHEHQSLLKVHFPVNVHTDEATFEIQYGNLTRKTHANTSWDRARFESCGQKWMDLSEGHYGVSMLNDCKYGHSVKDSVIGLTLIKSGIEPNPTTDQEVHHFTYAIYPHAEKWQAAGTVPQAFFLNQPALAVQGGKPGESFSLAGLDAPNVVLETIKRAEDGDGAIVRMYECENSLTNVTMDWNLPFHAAESCNCLEQPDGEPVEVKDGKITFTVKPYEIKTIRIR